MAEPAPLVFEEQWADREFTGVPLVESILAVFIGRCQVCGREAEEQVDGTVLTNAGHIDGTLYGDTFCVGCLDDIPDRRAFVVAPTADPSEDERLA